MLNNDPLWYKDAIIYEVHVRAFSDGLVDGIGDFKGLTDRLDYLQDLGITAIWLLPFYPSPLKDDGYDIADYTSIHPNYGVLDDFREFLDAAHSRGLRVITELVINHTSDQHPWFQRARRSPPGSPERDFYVWSDTPDKYRGVRIIFKDFEASNWSWDPLAKAYYWHRFYSHQPDLNFDNPAVWQALLPVVDFWLEMGVDGMRLDAVPYLYEREGTNCENLSETHSYLRALRAHVDQKFPNRMLLAEANQWPEDAVAYFGNGDECHMCFHFPVMPRLFMAIHREDRFPIVDIMDQTPEIPPDCQWAMFLRNHDELTLEMVTDEERDYMYRVYAVDPQARINLGIRRRLAPLLGNNRRRIELMNALLFSMPGTPVIYYGDEIGMGDNIYLGDRNGVRTPMQWSADRNAGFSRCNPQRLFLPVTIDPEYHYEAINVEAQQNNPNSLLWWMKRLIGLRKRFPALTRGSLEFLQPDNRKILAFLRSYEDESILVVANLSRFVQYVELDLHRFKGISPVELFGSTPFPRIGQLPYLLTLSPHAFYWFAISQRYSEEACGMASAGRTGVPQITHSRSWDSLFSGGDVRILEQVLAEYLCKRRWFGSKARVIKSVHLGETFRLDYASGVAFLAFVRVEFNEGEPDNYALTIAFATGEHAQTLLDYQQQAIIAQLNGRDAGVLYDPFFDRDFCSLVLDSFSVQRSIPGSKGGMLTTWVSDRFGEIRGPRETALFPTLSKVEQSNTSVIYGDQLILKTFRRVDQGVNPELELGRFFEEKGSFSHGAPIAGAIEYRRRNAPSVTLAVLQQFVPNEGDAWQYTLDELSGYFEDVTSTYGSAEVPETLESVFDVIGRDEPDPTALQLFGGYLESARLLGMRAGEMHLALASEKEHPDFVPEPFSELYQRSVYQSLRSQKIEALHLLKRQISHLPAEWQPHAQAVLDNDALLTERFRRLLDQRLHAERIRCHGDFHLGQVLFTGRDFIIIDFEGPPAQTISERRIKRSPLRDVAGMVRSFHYAAQTALFGQSSGRGQARGVVRHEDLGQIEPWADFWYFWVSASFLRSYLTTTAEATFLPKQREELRMLFELFLLDKAIYELAYELNHRPTWVGIPLRGILQLLEIKVERSSPPISPAPSEPETTTT